MYLVDTSVWIDFLQGARDQIAFDRLRVYFSSQRFYSFPESRQFHESAAQDCRRQGITVRSTLDCLIAQCAIEHGLVLLHHDRDLLNMGMVVPAFRQKHFLNTNA